MTQPLDIVIRTTKEGTGLEQTSAELQQVGQEGESAGFSLGGLTKKTEVAGIGMKDFNRIGKSALMAVAFSASELTDGIGGIDKNASKAMSSVLKIGTAFAFGGPATAVVTGLGLAIGAVVGNLNATSAASAEAAKAIAAPYEEVKKEIADLIKLKGLDVIAQSIPTTTDALKSWIATDKVVANGVEGINERAEKLAALQAQEQAAADKASNLQTQYNRMKADADSVPAEAQGSWYLEQVDQLRDLKKEIDSTLAEYYKLEHEVAQQQALVDAATQATRAAMSHETEDPQVTLNRTRQKTNEQFDYNKQITEESEAFARVSRWLADNKTKSDALASALDKVAANMKSILGGAIDKALTPTTVTDADIAATKSGKYQNKWDEAARRFDDIAKNNTGDKWERQTMQLNMLGMSAEEAATKFRDFSLFADPKNMALVDWGAVTTDVETQLDQMVGKLNVSEEAMQQVWNKLPEDKRSALKKLGIASADDATKALLGEKPSQFNIVPAPEFAGNLAQMKSDILNNIPPEMYATVYVTYKTDTGGGGGGTTNGGWGGAPGSGGGTGARAVGGPTALGGTYAINENGQELLVSAPNGQMVSHSEAMQALSGTSYGGDTININLGSGASLSSARQVRALAEEVSRLQREHRRTRR